MFDLYHSLQGSDLGHLRIIAELWGLEFNAPDARVGIQRLLPMLLDRESLSDVLETLPEPARAALDELLRNEGRLPWSQFERRYGELRKMGAARRDRERPYQLHSASVSEALWYRGLIGRSMTDAPNGPEEVAFVPEDLLALIPAPPPRHNAPIGRMATAAEKAYILPATDRILDDACTLLAALRMQHTAAAGGRASRKAPTQPPARIKPGQWLLVNSAAAPYPLTPEALKALLAAAGLLDANGAPQPEPARRFLEAPRCEALLILFRGWLRSPVFNDLYFVPTLAVEGDWKNDPLRARRAALDSLFTIPGAYSDSRPNAERPFWSLAAFVASIRQTDPDYQRSAGEYDTWYLRDQATGEYLRGFENWDAVDGELARFMIAGPLHWLGVVDLGLPAAPAGEGPLAATAFRLTAWAADLLNLKAPAGFDDEVDRLQVGSNGRVRVPRLMKRSVRYQLTRFAACEKYAQEHYQYRLTPAALDAATKSGLRVAQLLALLRRHAGAIPPNLVQALEGWEANGSRARLDQLLVLRVKDPELLNILRGSKLARYLGEPLGPTAAVVRSGAADKLLDGLAELGYLGEAYLGDGEA